MQGLDWLPERIREPIEQAVEAIVSALGSKVVAICLIGPAARRDRPLRGTHAELLLVAQTLDAATLTDLAEGLAGPLRSGLQIRTVTSSELAGSVDVHALEIAQWRDHHLLLSGRDPFAGLDITSADLRHEIERAVRSLSQRLRNRMLWCLATEQIRLDAVLREALDTLTTLAHHTLTLVGETAPREEYALLRRFVAWAGRAPEPIMRLRERLDAPRASNDPLGELAALTATTEAICARVDMLRV